MEKIDEHIESLIIGYLEHRLTEEESVVFYQWLKENEENEKFFLSLKAIDNLKQSSVNFDPDTGFELLRDKIQTQKKLKRKRVSLSYWSIAAVIAVLAFSVGYVFKSGLFSSVPTSVCEFVTDNASGSLNLPDGTTIWMAPYTKVRYMTDYGQKERYVELEGEAFFDVAKNKEIPFVVNVSEQQIRVKGTKFNVTSYSRDSEIVTTLMEGCIEFYANNKIIELNPGEQIRYDSKNKSLRVLEVDDVKTEIDWLDDRYEFDGVTFENILERMKNVYNVTFVCSNQKIMQTSYRVTFYQGESLSEFLQIVNNMTGLSASVKADTVQLK